MMARANVPFFFLIGALALAQACAAQSIQSQTYGFAETTNGGWKVVSIDKLQDYLVASKVTCGQDDSNIEIVWNSESGDWAAFDKYSSKGIFFSRVIRFAQFDQTIQIVKERPESRAVMKIGGDDVKQYEYLLNELKIWTRRGDFPYRVPDCAAAIFQAR